jgi:Domain of unknown function (DUF6431)
MIVFIPQAALSGKGESADRQGEEWLPRICPRCGQWGVVGHGRRSKGAYDEHRTRIRIRRCICNHCDLTITVLPAYSLPYTRYSLYARQRSFSRCAEGSGWEQAAPPTPDPDRIAEPATLRRWAQRRLCSVWACVAAAKLGANWTAPTIFSWDWPAAARMLGPEPKPG